MFWLGLAALAGVAEPVRLPPVERCGDDPSFIEFRRSLERSVAARDLDGLVSLMSEDVRVSFGGRMGREQFRSYWAGRERTEQLWTTLGEVIALGCAGRVDGMGRPYRAMPAMFMTSGALDGFTTWVSRPGAVLRSRPHASAPVIMRLPDWTVLREDDERQEAAGFRPVITPRHRRGFVAEGQARSLIDYRLVFEPGRDGWRISAFVAGD